MRRPSRRHSPAPPAVIPPFSRGQARVSGNLTLPTPYASAFRIAPKNRDEQQKSRRPARRHSPVFTGAGPRKPCPRENGEGIQSPADDVRLRMPRPPPPAVIPPLTAGAGPRKPCPRENGEGIQSPADDARIRLPGRHSPVFTGAGPRKPCPVKTGRESRVQQTTSAFTSNVVPTQAPTS